VRFIFKSKKSVKILCIAQKKLDNKSEFAYCALQQLLQRTTTGDLK